MEKWEPKIFSQYLHCMYRDSVRGSATVPVSNASCRGEALQEDKNAIETLFETLVQVYLIADEVRDLYSDNIISDEIINLARRTQEFPGAKAIILAYASLDHVNTLCKLPRDFYVHDSTALPSIGEIPRKFLEDVIERFHFGKELSIPRLARGVGEFISVVDWTVLENHKKCQYHQHDGDHLECV